MPVTTLEVEQGPGLGTAKLAATGLGWYAELDECVENFVTYGDTIIPIPENVDKYQCVYEVYRKIYPQTRMLCGKDIVGGKSCGARFLTDMGLLSIMEL